MRVLQNISVFYKAGRPSKILPFKKIYFSCSYFFRNLPSLPETKWTTRIKYHLILVTPMGLTRQPRDAIGSV
jgi:hypothetical protein